MADCLNVVGAGLLLLLSGSALAEIGDPTRPPAGFRETLASGAAEIAPPPPAVTSLFLMGDKPYAVVDGQIVRPGDPLAGGRVTRIDAAGVWLRIGSGKGAAGLRQLKWLPEIDKSPSATLPRAGMENHR
jgi:hypothetical protein